jgi:hypothetical protein
MSLPQSPDVHHLDQPDVACLACQRDRRHATDDWPPGWNRRRPEPWSWAEAERSRWAPEWREVRLLLGWLS